MPESVAARSPFGPAQSTQRPERRAWARSYSAHLTVVQVREKPHLPATRVILDNLSEKGIGLVFLRPRDPGSTLFVQLRGRQAGSHLTYRAQVAHASPLPDGTWLVGCTLAPELTDADVRCALNESWAES